MRSAMASILPGSESEGSTLSASKRERLRAAIEHGIHYLPTQGPISVFVHHNTLHAFEDLPFEQAVLKGGELYGCEPYLSEDQYREEFQRGRISIDHLRQIMMDDLGDQADELIASFGTRYTLRLAMLQMTLHTASDAELRWLLAETDLLTRFRDEVTPHRREELISLTRRWVLQQVEAEDGRSAVAAGEIPSGPLPAVAESLLNEMGRHKVQSWPSEKWETFTLRLLWKLCRQGVLSADVPPADQRATVRPRDYLWQATGQDSDRLVNEVLIRFCGVFLDQGFSDWPLPDRE
ncbi:MAG: DUF2309 family protein, partial [Planctomycetales bacterium]|nr:DUF2309 family protein [Planctomycetales bacterium]